MAAALTALALLAGPAPRRLHAQHGSVTTGDPAVGDCALCHTSHDTGFNQATLKLGNVAGIVVDAPGIGPLSQSCLRCHFTESLRAQQSELQKAELAGQTGLYIERDLTDDHPLGRFDTGRLQATNRISGAKSADLGRMRSKVFALDQESVIECTTCHDPHDQRGATPAVEEERALCTNCHETGRYAFVGGHADIPCSGCHVMHGGYESELLAERSSNQVCAGCHEGSWASATTDPTSAVALRRALILATIAPPSAQAHLDPPQGECVQCHAPHTASKH
ncbi:MAG: hypothetical protein JSU87_14085 [Gemmatimonadota bacterium]|nr:MAG: hypothetical protein JSU87_14085 [Gemmatimonadota bacterium]